MIDPRQLGFDIDGVVADTMHLFIDIAREVYGLNHIGYQDITNYHLEQCLDMPPETIRAIVAHIIEGDYPCRLAPIEGAGEVLQRLCAFGPIRMVTARPRLGPIGYWMDELLPPARCRVQIVATGSFEAKSDVLMDQKVAYFVEDRLDTCYLIKERGITPVLFAQPWNRQPHPFIEVNGWRQLEMLIDFE
jgi:uncharacterized protein